MKLNIINVFIIFSDNTTPDESTILYNGEEVTTIANKNLGNRFIHGYSIDGFSYFSRSLKLNGSLSYVKGDENETHGPMPSISPIFGTFLMKGTSPQKTPTICLIKNQNKKSNITLISYEGRDPGQHVYNLIQKGIHHSNSLMDLDIFVKGPRKIFLVNPLRVLIEPLVKSENDLLHFRKKNIPLYPVRNLGQILTYGQFELKKQNGFILDKRSQEKLSCLEKKSP